MFERTRDDSFDPGELFVYTNGDRWELGQVKRANIDGTGYFCWYSTGDTAANTPVECMHKLANAGWTHVERTCRNVHETEFQCSECGAKEYGSGGRFHADGDGSRIYAPFNYCPSCGRRVSG